MIRMSLLASFLVVATSSGAAETVKIYRSMMPDGSVVLGDKPMSGARSVSSRSYVLKAPQSAAEAERDYWRRQSEAFNRRQQQDLQAPWGRISPRFSRHVSTPEDDVWPPVPVYPSLHGSRPLVPLHRVPRHYTSSPGAARGRSSGFIGSGFSTSR